MKRLVRVLIFSLLAVRAISAPAQISLPDFPPPPLARDLGGTPIETSVICLLRDLHLAGVHGADFFEAVDSDYAVLSSTSLAHLTTWLEAACAGIGLDLTQARSGKYDGAVYARLLGVATSIAATRRRETQALAIPIGVLICKRTAAWGQLQGDGSRDAYVLFATERGLIVYDPPTRQVATLKDFPNHREVLRVRL